MKKFGWLFPLLLLSALPLQASPTGGSKTEPLAKWSSVYIGVGKTTSPFVSENPDLMSSTLVGYRRHRGYFAYGAEYLESTDGGKFIKNYSSQLRLSPDWTVEVEPYLEFGFGYSEIRQEQNRGQGTAYSYSVGLDLASSQTLSTAVRLSNTHITTNLLSQKTLDLQSLTLILVFHMF